MPTPCFIRYEIDPVKKDQFTAYAENWARIIPRLGGHLLGYFVPQEGCNYETTRGRMLSDLLEGDYASAGELARPALSIRSNSASGTGWENR